MFSKFYHDLSFLIIIYSDFIIIIYYSLLLFITSYSYVLLLIKMRCYY